MTARAVERDAALVYAEGVLRGLVMASAVLGKDDWSALPAPLRKLLIEWRGRVQHFEQQAEADIASDLPLSPLTEQEAAIVTGAFACPHCRKALSLWR